MNNWIIICVLLGRRSRETEETEYKGMAARGSKYQRRRGRFGVLYKLLSVLLILAALVGGCIVFFRVERITVTGSTTYTQQQIIDATGVEMGDNLFLVQKVPTARKILNALPYIKTVNIRRDLPNELDITLTECVPVAALKGEDGVWWILDSSGKLLEQVDLDGVGSLMKITGLTALKPSEGGRLAVAVEDTTRLESLKAILSELEARGMYTEAADLDLSGVTEIHMTYRGRLSVRMPMYSDDFRHLIHALQAVADNSAVVDRSGTVDLTGERPRFIPNDLSF